MAQTNALKTQIDEHEAVRAAVRQLDERYSRRSRETPLSPDVIRNVRWSLFYLLEGVNSHFTRDDSLVFPLVKPAIRETLRAEHEAIRAAGQSALTSVTAMAESAAAPQKLAHDASALGEMIHHVRELIDQHTAREDVILREAVSKGRRAEAPPGTEYQVH